MLAQPYIKKHFFKIFEFKALNRKNINIVRVIIIYRLLEIGCVDYHKISKGKTYEFYFIIL